MKNVNDTYCYECNCVRLGFDWIGFEKEEEYVKIANARINSFDTIDNWI